MLQATIWYGATMTAALWALAVLRRRAARRLRAEPGNAAEILYRFSGGGSLVMLCAVTAGLVPVLIERDALIAVSQVRGALLMAALLGVLSLMLSWTRLGLERTVRPAGWSRRAMMRVHLFFHVPMLGTMLIAAAGEAATIATIEWMGHATPAWSGAVWVLAAVVIAMFLPTGRLLGRAVEAPVDLVEEFNRRAGVDQPPPLIVLDTGGAQYVNAFAFWRPGKSWIAVGDGLMASFTLEQTLAVLMHELGHVVNGDSRRSFLLLVGFQAAGTLLLIGTGLLIGAGVANLLTGFAVLTLGAVMVVPWLSRRAEHRCDQFAAERTDPQVMAEALRRMHELNLQPTRFDRGARTTHPDLTQRLEALDVPAAEEHGASSVAEQGGVA